MPMPPTKLERENLEAHVDLCHQRYVQLDGKINTLDDKVDAVHKDVDSLNKEIASGNKSMVKTIITAAGTIIAGLLSTIIVILIAFL